MVKYVWSITYPTMAKCDSILGNLSLFLLLLPWLRCQYLAFTMPFVPCTVLLCCVCIAIPKEQSKTRYICLLLYEKTPFEETTYICSKALLPSPFSSLLSSGKKAKFCTLYDTSTVVSSLTFFPYCTVHAIKVTHYCKSTETNAILCLAS